ncbi:MAG TPA: 23S rRNA (adenine(2030)-N(6))-methyltransferase RlmJ [Caulobacteraceae bacterium]|nr:23S rRNA (adenine(2030)-N(6))-methyltransferase RlmJ [Caulobacteraceae bacterium]
MLLHLLERLTATPGSLAVLDTHAGAGAYDLEGEQARRSGEARQGVVRLMADAGAPAALDLLKRAVEVDNPEGGVKLYPGSPLLIARRLRPGDHYTGCELRPDDFAELELRMRPYAGARARLEDGYATLEGWKAGGKRLALIDPPFERGDEYARVVAGARAAIRARPDTAVLIWTPLKDLETFDAFLGGLEATPGVRGLAVQARLKPLDDPLRMNGCALAVLGDPALLDALTPSAQAIAGWTVAALGGAGGAARVERIGR